MASNFAKMRILWPQTLLKCSFFFSIERECLGVLMRAWGVSSVQVCAKRLIHNLLNNLIIQVELIAVLWKCINFAI